MRWGYHRTSNKERDVQYNIHTYANKDDHKKDQHKEASIEVITNNQQIYSATAVKEGQQKETLAAGS